MVHAVIVLVGRLSAQKRAFASFAGALGRANQRVARAGSPKSPVALAAPLTSSLPGERRIRCKARGERNV